MFLPSLLPYLIYRAFRPGLVLFTKALNGTPGASQKMQLLTAKADIIVCGDSIHAQQRHHCLVCGMNIPDSNQSAPES